MSIDPKQFRHAMGQFATGITVVTVSGEEGPHGMTANAFSSLSLDPPLVLVCVKKGTQTHGLLAKEGGFAVNILSDQQEELSNRFAGMFPPEKDKFADLSFQHGSVSGAPMLEGSIVSFDCRSHAAHDGGDHTIFVGEVAEMVGLEGETLADPVLFFRGRYRRLSEQG